MFSVIFYQYMFILSEFYIKCHLKCAIISLFRSYYYRHQRGAAAMGPFPHDAPPPKISTQNPMGTDGFEFVEFTHPDPQELDRLFRLMGFTPVAKHRSKDVTLYRQGGINFIVNKEKGSFARNFAEKHGPSAPAMAFRVVDAK